MSKKKACKKDKFMVEGEECPICHGAQFVTNWKGRLAILDPAKSVIAKKINVTVDGEYAIKVS